LAAGGSAGFVCGRRRRCTGAGDQRIDVLVGRRDPQPVTRWPRITFADEPLSQDAVAARDGP
jgi:hypothetical protein